jgi:trans-aconitate methyltransferase
MNKMYKELARWWPLLSDPADYKEEVDFFLPLLSEVVSNRAATLLELGSGGGNNASHMKSSFSSVTLVDLSSNMLEVSKELNPDCEHIQEDMRTVRLNRAFDVVFIHDAIDYMVTQDDLRQAIETAYIHCKSGGMALFIPDHVRETFEARTNHGGEDGDAWAVRYLEWTFDPDEDDTSYISDYVIVVREGNEVIKVEHDHHIIGLFVRNEWLSIITEVGFNAECVIDNFGRDIFVARKA